MILNCFLPRLNVIKTGFLGFLTPPILRKEKTRSFYAMSKEFKHYNALIWINMLPKCQQPNQYRLVVSSLPKKIQGWITISIKVNATLIVSSNIINILILLYNYNKRSLIDINYASKSETFILLFWRTVGTK